jgi:predicted Na+-dependent transporter
MKILYTHAAATLLSALVVFSLSFVEAFNEIKTNSIGVILFFIVMAVIGYFFAKLFYSEKEGVYGKKL